jgi:hypothetical protein
MQRFVTPRTSFEELFTFANAEIHRHGFENLDFLGNVGHSIESSRETRRYIEAGNKQLLGTPVCLLSNRMCGNAVRLGALSTRISITSTEKVVQWSSNKVFHGTPSHCAPGAREHRR